MLLQYILFAATVMYITDLSLLEPYFLVFEINEWYY